MARHEARAMARKETKIKHAKQYTDGGTDSHAKGRAQPTGASVSMHACVVSATAISLHRPRHTHLCCLRCAPSLLAAACGKKPVRRHTSKKCLHQLLLCCSAARGSGNTATLAVSMPALNSLCCAGEQHIGAARGVGSLRATRQSPLTSSHLMQSAQPGTRVMCRPLAAGLASSSGHCAGTRLTFFRMFEGLLFFLFSREPSIIFLSTSAGWQRTRWCQDGGWQDKRQYSAGTTAL